MAELNEKIQRACQSIANRLGDNDDERDDALQEGLTKVLEMEIGHADYYYIQYAKRRMQNYLKKERKIINNYVCYEEGVYEGGLIKSRRGYKIPITDSLEGYSNNEE